jgi:hypothetical protein
MTDPEDVFGPVIYAYTRTDALRDGELTDVTALAREAGIRFPTAITRTVYAEYVAAPAGVVGQDETGRLWDVLWMFRCAPKRHSDTCLFQLHVRNDNRDGPPPLVTLKALCHPSDHGEPVITIMLPTED